MRNATALLRFLLVGLANTAIGYGLIMYLHYGLAVPHFYANTAGYVAGGAVSYWLNRHFTFESERSHSAALPLFVGAVLVCFALNAAVLALALNVWKLPFPAAQALAMFSYTAAFFVLNKFVVFSLVKKSAL